MCFKSRMALMSNSKPVESITEDNSTKISREDANIDARHGENCDRKTKTAANQGEGLAQQLRQTHAENKNDTRYGGGQRCVLFGGRETLLHIDPTHQTQISKATSRKKVQRLRIRSSQRNKPCTKMKTPQAHSHSRMWYLTRRAC